MAEPDILVIDLQLFAEERQEAPTARRRQQARQRGQVFKSVELTGALVFLLVVGILHFYAPGAVGTIMDWTRRLWLEPVRDWSPSDARVIAEGAAGAWFKATLPFLLLAMVVGAGLSLAQTGFVLSTQGLVPSFSHLNPARGFQRIFSIRGLVELLKSVIKVAVVSLVAYTTVADAFARFPALVGMPPAASAAVVAGWVDRLALRIGAALLALAAADFFYQRWEYERSLRMSRQEIKEEVKETEGDPSVRAARRRRQRELARRRMLQDVAKAQVVITNPDHFAVALAYKPEEHSAPVVLAKGRGHLAQQIKALAREHGVAIVEDPPLARSLYKLVDVGKAIPEELYQAVAQVLAFVWRIKGYDRR